MKTIRHIAFEFIEKVECHDPYINTKGSWDFYADISGLLENKYYSVYFKQSKSLSLLKIKICEITQNQQKIVEILQEIEPSLKFKKDKFKNLIAELQ